MSALARRAAARPGGRAVLVKHLPTAGAFLVATVAVVAARDTLVVDPASVVAGIALEVVATLGALGIALHRRRAGRAAGGGRDPVDDRQARSDPWALAVPLVSMLAIGLLRVGTGGSESLFTAMLILPVIWIAAEPGRRPVALAAAGSSAALVLPVVTGLDTDALAPWRAVFAPFVYALAALTINELAARLRRHLAQVRAADRVTRSVIDAVTEQAIIGTDRTGLVDVWNPGAVTMLRLPAAAAQGQRRIQEFVRTQELDDRRPQRGGITAFLTLVAPVQPGRADVAEWTAVRADGTTLPVLLSITARLDEAGEIAGYLFVAADQTQAHETARLQDQFVGTISHELRTPVSAVLGHLELLRDDPLTADQEQHIAVAERNAHRLLHLVGDLLLAAQVEAGGFRLDPADVDLAPLARASVQSAAPEAARAGVTVVLRGDDAAVPARGDAVRLGQACDNLVSNALKFTPRGGSVTVTVGRAEGSARLVVADTGIGVPADEQERLFGRFFRASTAVRGAVPGVGLGLAITHAIVTAHGGRITVTSEEGRGTTFAITLPDRPDRPDRPDPPEPPPGS